MHFNGKALYNLLKINWKKDPSLPVQNWQVKDYRLSSQEDLFAQLKNYGINLDATSFCLYADNCDSPEELLEHLWLEEDNLELRDRIYLLLFELWRKILPEKRSLSIFCDEVDYAIEHYLDNPLGEEEKIQEILHEMSDILDENVDLGEDPKQIFASMEEGCAYNIESFLYDYILTLIKQGNDLGASEVLDGFYSYVNDLRWFDFLRARLLALTSTEEANLMICGLLEQLEEEPDLDFLLEIASYLAHTEDAQLFAQAIMQGVEFAEDQQDLNDLLELIATYYTASDREDKAQTINTLLERPHSTLKEDKQRVLTHLQNADWSKI